MNGPGGLYNNLSLSLCHTITTCLCLLGTLLQPVFPAVAQYYNWRHLSIQLAQYYNLLLTCCASALLQSVFDSMAHLLQPVIFFSPQTVLQFVIPVVAHYYNLSLTPWHTITTCLSLPDTVLQFVIPVVAHYYNLSLILWHTITTCLSLPGTVLQPVFDSVAHYYNLSFSPWHSITTCHSCHGTLLQPVFLSLAQYYKLSFLLWHSITTCL